MSLERWAEYGWLKAEPSSRDEIRGLIAIIDRDIADANVTAVSDDRRFEAAFSAIRTCATLALRASGFRTTTQPGHHTKTLESLALTLGENDRVIRRLRTFSQKRNATSYDAAGNVTRQELESAIQTAMDLRSGVLQWLKKNHPHLLK